MRLVSCWSPGLAPFAALRKGQLGHRCGVDGVLRALSRRSKGCRNPWEAHHGLVVACSKMGSGVPASMQLMRMRETPAAQPSMMPSERRAATRLGLLGRDVWASEERAHGPGAGVGPRCRCRRVGEHDHLHGALLSPGRALFSTAVQPHPGGGRPYGHRRSAETVGCRAGRLFRWY